ncbi:MAG: hypothetical protein HYZ74_08745, partial [Elusimicrobia bacterium]|nr:hypothetical protein [Elusimicrobiota bacterium]
MTGKDGARPLPSILKVLGVSKAALFASSTFALAAAGAEAATVAAMGALMASLVRPEGPGDFSALAAVIVCSALGKAVFTYASSALVAATAGSVLKRVRDRIFAAYLEQDKEFHDVSDAGRLSTAVLDFPSVIESRLKELNQAILWVALLIVYSCTMIWISWRMAMCVALGAPMLQLFIRRLTRSASDLSVRAAAV